MDERKRALRRGKFRLEQRLRDEWWQVFRVGLVRKDHLDRGDVVVPKGPDPLAHLLHDA